MGNSQGDSVTVFLDTGAGGFRSIVNYGAAEGVRGLNVLYLDGDLDMVTSNFSSGSWNVYENAGDGTFGNRRALSADRAGSCATLHDRDRDGDLDMTGVDELADLLFLLTNSPPVATGDGNSGRGAPSLRTFSLAQNHPNPFNPVTTIGYELSGEAVVRLTVYDLRGRAVRTLVSSRQQPGRHTAVWNGRDDGGRVVPSGVYLYRLEAGDLRVSRKMLLTR